MEDILDDIQLEENELTNEDFLDDYEEDYSECAEPTDDDEE